MAIAFVQAQAGNGFGTSSLTVNITATSGNLLYVMIDVASNGAGPAGTTINAPSDGVNTYTAINAVIGQDYDTGRQFYAKNITGGSLTLTINVPAPAGGPFVAMSVLEFSGCDTSAPLKGSATGTTSSGTSITTASLSVSAASGDLLVAGVGNYSTPSWTAGNPSGMVIPSGASAIGGTPFANSSAEYLVCSGTQTSASINVASAYGTIQAAVFSPAVAVNTTRVFGFIM